MQEKFKHACVSKFCTRRKVQCVPNLNLFLQAYLILVLNTHRLEYAYYSNNYAHASFLVMLISISSQIALQQTEALDLPFHHADLVSGAQYILVVEKETGMKF